jgi:hypothetical protein
MVEMLEGGLGWPLEKNTYRIVVRDRHFQYTYKKHRIFGVFWSYIFWICVGFRISEPLFCSELRNTHDTPYFSKTTTGILLLAKQLYSNECP